MTEELVLSLRHVTAGYREGGVLGRKRFHEVLHDVSFDVHRGEICGLVGESGTGKSTLARTILQMVKPEQGEVIHYTKRPQMIFQDPYSSLNPAYQCQHQFPCYIHGFFVLRSLYYMNHSFKGDDLLFLCITGIGVIPLCYINGFRIHGL